MDIIQEWISKNSTKGEVKNNFRTKKNSSGFRGGGGGGTKSAKSATRSKIIVFKKRLFLPGALRCSCVVAVIITRPVVIIAVCERRM